jgi:hypothetical protein
MPRSRSTSYAWALHAELGQVSPWALSDSARLGLEYAERLARDAPLRSRQALRNQQSYLQPLTVAELAEEEAVSVGVILARIGRARRQLFGSLTDSAIYKRKRAQEALKARRRAPDRPCAQPDCPQALPVHARSNRRYCDLHASTGEKVRRHRAAAPNPAADQADSPSQAGE